MKTEIEVKQLCDEGFSAEELICRFREVTAVEDRGTEVHSDSYYDTATRALSAAGLTARCRTRAGDRALEIKLVPLIPELIMRRIEISEPWPQPQPAGPALRRLVEDALGYGVEGRLEEQLTLETRRQRYAVSSEDCRAELCIDDVAVHRNGDDQDESFLEVELELEVGEESAFATMAEVLTQTPRLRRSTKSKFTRSCELLGLPAPRFGPAYPKFSPEETAHVASRRVCGALLGRIEAHRAGTRLGLDLEHLHKMRVATRRLQVAVASFGARFAAEDRDWLRSELKWLAAILGEVRDLDVQKLEVARRGAASEPAVARGWKALDRELQARWEPAQRGLRAELEGARYRELLRRAFAAFALASQAEGRGRGALPVRMLAGRLLRKRARSLEKALEAWRHSPTPTSVHALRISGKKLRYAGLLFRHLGPEDFQGRLRELARIQDDLGLIQDRAVLGELARELRDAALLRGDGGPYLLVLGQLIGEAEASSRFALAEVERVLGGVDVRALAKKLAADARELAQRKRRQRRQRA